MAVQNHLFSQIPTSSAVIPPGLSLPERHRDVDKFGCGRVVVVGGATGMAGAPALSAMAALRSGAGLVELHVPDSVATIAAGFSPCVMTRGHASDAGGTFALSSVNELLARAERADVLVCGPGLGRTSDTVALVKRLWQASTRPAVFDADGLWALAQLSRRDLAEHAAPRLLTPHGGEMLRFLPERDAVASAPRRPARADLEQKAAALASAIDAVIVLKGPNSLVTDGTRRWHNTTGNPGMATAGSGDVLSGVLAALTGSGIAPFAAAQLAVWAHGHAGDLAASQLGQTSLIATDLIEFLPRAFLTLERRADEPRSPATPAG